MHVNSFLACGFWIMGRRLEILRALPFKSSNAGLSASFVSLREGFNSAKAIGRVRSTSTPIPHAVTGTSALLVSGWGGIAHTEARATVTASVLDILTDHLFDRRILRCSDISSDCLFPGHQEFRDVSASSDDIGKSARYLSFSHGYESRCKCSNAAQNLVVVGVR